MLDFVIAEFDTLRSGHLGRNMSADAQSVFVRLVDDRRHQSGLYRAVNLDLDVAQAHVVIYSGARFLFRGDQHLGGSLVRPAAINDSGQNDARADLLAFLNALAAGQQQVGIVTQVAHRRDAGGKIQQTIVLSNVGVHVPETGQQGLTRPVDHLRSRRRGYLLGWSHIADAIADNHNTSVFKNLRRLSIEDVDMCEHDAVRRGMSQLAGEFSGSAIGGFILRGLQGLDTGLPRFRHHRGSMGAQMRRSRHGHRARHTSGRSPDR